jgi:hypothetical protein
VLVGLKLLFLVAQGLALVGCTTANVKAPFVSDIPPTTMQRAVLSPPFSQDEALAAIEFCVDLDAQDDHFANPGNPIYAMVPERIANWDKVYDSRVDLAARRGLNPKDAADPVSNGFGSFDSAWTLWKKKGERAYIVALRGTVFKRGSSVVEDALASTVAADDGVEFPAGRYVNLTFARLPRAEVHTGFAYGSFECVFDGTYGILKQLETNPLCSIPQGSTVIFTGHSQGAGVATLTHAFFYYASLKEGDPFRIGARRLTLRSYVFAQPKPGNEQFSADFAGITRGGSTSFVFNNTIDAVPFLPPTHQFAFSAFEDCPQNNNVPGWPIIRGINNLANSVSSFFSRTIEKSVASRVASMKARGGDGIYLWDSGWLKRRDDHGTPAEAVSQNYSLAGTFVPLIGNLDGSSYFNNPDDARDPFIQHHSQVYRKLLEVIFEQPHLPTSS